MLTDSHNLKPVSAPRFDGLSIKVRLFFLILLPLLVLMPSVTQADGLFDFQMKLAKKGNAGAQFKVGEMYETGFGVNKDMAEAKSWIMKANEKGHETAGFKLLYWDVEKNGVTAANKADIAALKAKANEDNGQAQYYVGKMHAYGVGEKKNPDEAINWLNKAALVGVVAAESELVIVRESKQQQAQAWKRSQEKKQAAKQESERKSKQEAQRKAQQKKQQQAKAQAEKTAKQKKATADARAKANKEAADKARVTAEAEVLAQRQADALRHEAEKQALMKKRAKDEKKRKVEFESDPCSGKSARFLSTCR